MFLADSPFSGFPSSLPARRLLFDYVPERLVVLGYICRINDSVTAFFACDEFDFCPGCLQLSDESLGKLVRTIQIVLAVVYE